jgi:enamine deaminase RidA (YjgF/YER057c/UK114 family)
LKEKGLSLKDVIYLRVYVVPDPQKGNKPDFEGWFAAYADFFNNAANPTKTARSTISVPALVNADWLIEIEAVAAYPK